MKQVFKKAATVLIWLSLIYACYELGIWQLHRAQELNKVTAPKPDQPLVVLVVREVLGQMQDQINSEVSITGRLYPRQNVDRAFAKPGELSRIDPALVVSKENPFLYDGYIILKSEKTGNNQSSDLTLVASEQISNRLPGFYWQHISYVVVWWFMGLLAYFS